MKNNPPILAAAAVRSRPLQCNAASVEILAAAADGSTCPSFDVLAYTGGELVVSAYDLPVVLDLAGLGSTPVVNANLDHVKTQPAGQADQEGVINDGKQLRIKGLLNAATPWRDQIVQSARDKYKWGASIEAVPKQGAVELVKAGQTATANGRTFRGPLYIARKSTLFGLAFLSKGTEADPSTVVTIAAASAASQEKVMTFAQWLAAQGFDEAAQAALTDQQKAFLQKTYDAEMAAVAASGGDANAGANGGAGASAGGGAVAASAKFDIDGLKAVYASHEAEIEKMIFGAGKIDSAKCAEIKASAYQAAVALKSTALQKEWSPLQFQVEAMKLQNKTQIELLHAERPQGPAIHASSKDVSPDVIEAALAQTVKLPNLDKHYSDKSLQAAHSHFRGRCGLKQVLIMAAHASGMHFGPGETINAGNLKQVLRHAFPVVEASGFSTINLSGILSNLSNKELLEGFMEDDSPWRKISRVSSASNFHQMTRYRMLDNFEYEELSPTGHMQHGTVSEESYTTQIKTYAKMFAVPRQDIINDDLRAFDDLRNRLARGAIKKFRSVFWAKFMDNSTFFTSGRGNYITGSTTNLGTDGVGLTALQLAAMQLKSSSADGAKRQALAIKYLLVPPELLVNAEKLYVGQNLNMGSGNLDPNTFQGKYEPTPVPELSDSAFTGYSSTAYYGVGQTLPPMEVSFLDGKEAPTVDSADADFDQLGIQARGYHDFGCDQAEYLGAVKSKGSA